MTPPTRATDPTDTHRFDVAIIGAGAAGIAAASAARRSVGKSVRILLVEASNRLGGSVTAAMHRSMCGLYSSMPDSPLETLNAFSQRDLVRRMLQKDPEHVTPRKLGRAPVLEFRSAVWEGVLAEMCSESNADLRLNCPLTNLRREGNRLTAVQIADPNPKWVSVSSVVDCTGGGNALRLAGEDAFHAPDDDAARMLAGFSVRLTGITGDPEMHRLQTIHALSRGVDKGLLPRLARFTSFYPGPGNGEGVCKLAINLNETGTDQGGAFAHQVVNFLKQETPGFAAAKIAEISPRVLPRDGLRLRGKSIVTEDDVVQGRKLGPDAVHAWWPMERWDISEGPSYLYPPAGEHYDIPLDALWSASIENLFAAGTCISATSGAAASTRASGICLATGDAAGKLAISVSKY